MSNFMTILAQFKAGALDRETFLHRMTEEICYGVGSTRASIWLYTEGRDAIACQDLYDIRDAAHTSGTVLQKAFFPEYFQAMEDHLKLVAPKARTHPATRCFADVYFEPTDIFSLLDVGILIRGQLVGVVCCEHCHEPRAWTAEDETIMGQAGTAIAMGLKL